MISNFQVFVNNFFKFFIKQGYKDSNLEMTESESVALPFGDSYMKRRGWDSNPRALADKRFSRPPRYDHFDTPARERVMGIEPTYPAWKAGVLPLNYTRIFNCSQVGVTGFEPATSWSQTSALAKLSHTPICCFAVSFLLPHRSDSDIISPYSILVNTFLHFFEINFSNAIHPAFLQCFR